MPFTTRAITTGTASFEEESGYEPANSRNR
jgi:hypothetical protein